LSTNPVELSSSAQRSTSSRHAYRDSLIALNIYGHFIGRELEGYAGDDEGKLGALQVAAKIQVIFAVDRTIFLKDSC
jgi:hypothetical protein